MGPVTAAVVVAGGSGERFGRAGGKQLAQVAGRPVVSWSLAAIDECSLAHIVVVCPESRIEEYRTLAVGSLDLRTPVSFAPSGPTRQDSVASGLAAVPSGTEIVVIHDGARPLVSPQVIRGAVEMLVSNDSAQGVVVGHPSIDTLKRVEGRRIVETVDRREVWSAQTPQVFRLESLVAAHALHNDARAGTDDAVMVERAGGTVLMFEGPRDNIKVTVPEDFAFVESVLTRRAQGG